MKIQSTKSSPRFAGEAGKIQSQAGVTMLLAILIMSGLILISTAVAALATEQIRASRAQIVSEPAFLAAKSGGEEGLWIIKRGDPTDVPVCPAATGQNFTASKSHIDFCKGYGPADITVLATSSAEVLLYNPNDPNGDSDLSEYAYNILSVTRRGPFAINVLVRRLDGTPVTSFVASTLNVATEVNLPAVAPGSEGRMIVTLSAAGDTLATVTTDKGLPSTLNIASTACANKNVAITACDTGAELYTRKIEVKFGN